MTNLITPPPELVQQWIKQCNDPVKPRWQEYEQDIANLAAQWGADQELEACLEHLFRRGFSDADILCLRAARRPKPLRLKEQALEALEVIPKLVGFESERDAIRRALEALDD